MKDSKIKRGSKVCRSVSVPLRGSGDERGLKTERVIELLSGSFCPLAGKVIKA
jgi:hypothetical protein